MGASGTKEPKRLLTDEQVKELDELNELSRGYGYDETQFEGGIIHCSFLNLSYRRLSALPQGLSLLTNLFRLNMSSNYVHAFPSTILGSTSLRELCIPENKLTSLPQELSCFTYLRNLDIGANEISALPLWISTMTDITRLEIQGNPMNSLNTAVLSLVKLQQLVIQDYVSGYINILRAPDQLTTLPCWTNQQRPSHGMMTVAQSLQTVDLYQKALSRALTYPLLDMTGDILDIQSLDISSNEISSLPDSFSCPTKLKKLCLTDNRLESFPICLCYLTEIELLDLAENMINDFPDATD